MSDDKGQFDLLIEGARSYPQALAALNEFQTSVIHSCRTALDSELPKISTAMRIKLSREDLRDRIRPRKTEIPDGAFAAIGLVINRDTPEGWRQYYHIVWDKDWFGASSSIRFKDKSVAMKVSKALNEAQPKSPYLVHLDDEKEACLTRRATAEEMAQLPGILQDLFREWARLWEKIGGLQS
jgi:hypothetical protein